MNEYISKEALQDKLNRKKAEPATKRYTEGWNDAILMVKSMIHSEKAADVAPVRHGRWKDNKCTACGEEAFCYGERPYHLRTDFCPMCGAKMNLED